MSLVSLKYFTFLSITILLFHLFKRYQKLILAIASMVFFGLYDQISLSVLVLSSVITFWTFKQEKRTLGIVLNIAFLALHHGLINSWSGLNIIPLLGISFFTIQNISFLKEEKRDVYFLDYFVLTSFFPKQLSGPILNFQEEYFEKVNWKTGLERITLGLFKKLVIADRLSDLVNSIFQHEIENPGLTQYTAIICFFIQLYFDFSAMVDIAIGSGKLLGIKLPENFNLPLRSSTVSEFWRRWHMTLMNWLVEYIFYPLSFFYRKSKWMAFSLPILLVFLSSGLWRGYEAKFLITVSLFGFIIIAEHFLKPLKPKMTWWKYISWFISFNLLAFVFTFLGTNSIQSALDILSSIFQNFLPSDFLAEFVAPLANGAHLNDQFNLILTFAFSFGTILFERRINGSNWNLSKWVLILLSIVLFANWENTTQFIYMQF